ncbi:MAG: purine-nucleoside phosphorylase, partial [Saprospiraceae bacterium]|nr:purine-nucleoside phosphorylase [Saprospiraceae bacterium]
HQGRLVIANLKGHLVLIMQGRFHYYEGHTMAEIGIPVRVFQRLGVKTILLTNAAGGINEHFQPGDLMIIEDHINFVQNNPLIGPNLSSFGTRFPDATTIYDKGIGDYAESLAREVGLTAHRGIYIFVSGPCFETPAEIRMMAGLGADAVGMSTVPEAIVARHAGMQIAGISLIANLAAGRNAQSLTHEEVMQTMEGVALKMNAFLNELAIYLARSTSQ